MEIGNLFSEKQTQMFLVILYSFPPCFFSLFLILRKKGSQLVLMIPPLVHSYEPFNFFCSGVKLFRALVMEPWMIWCQDWTFELFVSRSCGLVRIMLYFLVSIEVLIFPSYIWLLLIHVMCTLHTFIGCFFVFSVHHVLKILLDYRWSGSTADREHTKYPIWNLWWANKRSTSSCFRGWHWTWGCQAGLAIQECYCTAETSAWPMPGCWFSSSSFNWPQSWTTHHHAVESWKIEGPGGQWNFWTQCKSWWKFKIRSSCNYHEVTTTFSHIGVIVVIIIYLLLLFFLVQVLVMVLVLILALVLPASAYC